MKVIFLDFDGVIVTMDSHFTKPSERCLGNLRRIINETGAKIVVSSTWRHLYSKDYLSNLIGLDIYGVTPKCVNGLHRGHEIARWIINNTTDPLKVKFVILDDDDDMGLLIGNLVQTESLIGLTTSDANKAIEILNNK